MKGTTCAALMGLALLAGCRASPDDSEDSAARIDCALGGAGAFERRCTLDEMQGDEGAILVVGRADHGFRRLAITSDGRGVVAADGAEPATVTIVGDGMIEVAVGGDRYRLPADTGGAR